MKWRPGYWKRNSPPDPRGARRSAEPRLGRWGSGVDGWISRQAVETNMDVLENSGIFQGKWSYEELVDMRFVKQLAPELGITLPQEAAE